MRFSIDELVKTNPEVYLTGIDEILNYQKIGLISTERLGYDIET